MDSPSATWSAAEEPARRQSVGRVLVERRRRTASAGRSRGARGGAPGTRSTPSRRSDRKSVPAAGLPAWRGRATLLRRCRRSGPRRAAKGGGARARRRPSRCRTRRSSGRKRRSPPRARAPPGRRAQRGDRPGNASRSSAPRELDARRLGSLLALPPRSGRGRGAGRPAPRRPGARGNRPRRRPPPRRRGRARLASTSAKTERCGSEGGRARRKRAGVAVRERRAADDDDVRSEVRKTRFRLAEGPEPPHRAALCREGASERVARGLLRGSTTQDLHGRTGDFTPGRLRPCAASGFPGSARAGRPWPSRRRTSRSRRASGPRTPLPSTCAWRRCPSCCRSTEGARRSRARRPGRGRSRCRAPGRWRSARAT